MKSITPLLYPAFALTLCACSGTTSERPEASATSSSTRSINQPVQDFLLGADLSYVNEMLDCGAQYRVNGEVKNPYQIFSDAGNELVRVRLWHDPQWTEYSNFDDVARTIAQSKQRDMQVLLDFHYSDTWADPHKQYIPKAWEHLHHDTDALGDALYRYTYETLIALHHQSLLPEYVQIGNETNAEILQQKEHMQEDNINWERNAALLNRGLAAVSDFNHKYNTEIKTIIHIAQPENAMWWFKQARDAGLTEFDIMGLSYYGKWSEYKLDNLGQAVKTLIRDNNKDLMVVETAYPWGFDDIDDAANLLGPDSLLAQYPASAQGQLAYLQTLKQVIAEAGGMGVVYWEPGWVSTSCSTLWGQGSHWENATFFDATQDNEALPAFEFYQP